MNLSAIPHNVKVRLFSNFLGSIAYNAIFPFMVLYLNSIKGAVFAGTLMTVTTIVGYLMKLWGGYLADRFSRKRIVLIGNSVDFAAMLLLTVAVTNPEELISLFLVGYILHSVVASISSPSMQALIIDSSPSEIRKRVYTLTYWSGNVAASGGFFLGGLLYDTSKVLLLAILSLSIAMTVVLYAVYLQDIPVPKAASRSRNPLVDVFAHYAVALRNAPFVLTVLGFGLLLVGEEVIAGYVGIRLQTGFAATSLWQFNITGVRMFSIVMLENTIFVTLFTLFMSRVTDRFPRRKVLMLFSALYALGFVMLSWVMSLPALLFWGLVNSIGETVAIPLFSAEQTEMMTQDKRASYIALGSLANRMAALVGSGFIILSRWVAPLFMSAMLAALLFGGIVLIHQGLYVQKRSCDT